VRGRIEAMSDKRRDYIPPIPQTERKGLFSPEEREKSSAWLEKLAWLDVARAVIYIVIGLIGLLFFSR